MGTRNVQVKGADGNYGPLKPFYTLHKDDEFMLFESTGEYLGKWKALTSGLEGKVEAISLDVTEPTDTTEDTETTHA
ncbi:hypothetical protein [Ralstonia phage RP13]|nr:hypothetical protein [Ralstonia phage RP13]